MAFQDSLRGYAHNVHKRDGFKCVYCGWDGSQWPNWLFLSWDHLLPKGNRRRDDEDYIVTACIFCNVCHNRTKFPVRGKSPKQIIEIKCKAIMEKRAEYQEFWKEQVKGKGK